MGLRNSRAMVTGGASGLGAATTEWFGAQGTGVVVLDHKATDQPGLG